MKKYSVSIGPETKNEKIATITLVRVVLQRSIGFGPEPES